MPGYLITIQLDIDAEDKDEAEGIAYGAAHHLMETYNDNGSLNGIFNVTAERSQG